MLLVRPAAHVRAARTTQHVRRSGRAALALAALGIAAGAARPAAAHAQAASSQVANSQADFSSTQGQGNWYYGYWNRTADATGIYTAGAFSRFTTYDASSGVWHASASDTPYSGAYTQLGALGGHPNGTNSGGNEVWAIRRYVVQSAGDFSVAGLFGKSDQTPDPNGVGTTALIFVNGVQVFSRRVGETDPPAAYAAELGVLAAGTDVDFALTPNGVDYHDSSEYTAVISETPLATTAPEPATVGLVGAGLAGLAAVTRRRRSA